MGSVAIADNGGMKIIIAGGTGQIGRILTHHFHTIGHEVIVLSRHADDTTPWDTTVWDGQSLGAWADKLNGADVLINLAGRSVNCRYNEQNRQSIKRSRIDSTRILGAAIAHAQQPPRLWLQASTATIYAHRYDAPNDEATGNLGGLEADVPDTWRFSIDVAKSWEQVFNAADTPHTRKVALRSAMVMDPNSGGVFDTMLRLVRFGLGGRMGDGRQYVSWIHYADFIRALEWLIAHESFTGVVNLAAPNPLPNAEFMRVLRQTWGIPFGLPATNWMLEIGTFLLRTETELVLKSRRVVPGRLQAAGFKFDYANWQSAATDLCAQFKMRHASSVL